MPDELPGGWRLADSYSAKLHEARNEITALESKLAEAIIAREEAERERDNIQHAQIVAAQVEFNAMRYRAVAAETKATRLETALRDLLAEQNGPPLIRYAARWQAAVDQAEAALAPVEAQEEPSL